IPTLLPAKRGIDGATAGGEGTGRSKGLDGDKPAAPRLSVLALMLAARPPRAPHPPRSIWIAPHARVSCGWTSESPPASPTDRTYAKFGYSASHNGHRLRLESTSLQ